MVDDVPVCPVIPPMRIRTKYVVKWGSNVKSREDFIEGLLEICTVALWNTQGWVIMGLLE